MSVQHGKTTNASSKSSKTISLPADWQVERKKVKKPLTSFPKEMEYVKELFRQGAYYDDVCALLRGKGFSFGSSVISKIKKEALS